MIKVSSKFIERTQYFLGKNRLHVYYFPTIGQYMIAVVDINRFWRKIGAM
jgi:hypothetical protein